MVFKNYKFQQLLDFVDDIHMKGNEIPSNKSQKDITLLQNITENPSVSESLLEYLKNNYANKNEFEYMRNNVAFRGDLLDLKYEVDILK
mgnify:CR=1 FL=1